MRGRVEDNRDGRALIEVPVRVLAEGKIVAESVSDAEGDFHFTSLPPGTWSLEVDAPGYELSTASFEVPHRGEWSHARVRLRSLRWRVAEAFDPVAVELLGSLERAATHTHREAAAASEGPLAPDVGRLAEAVERLAYGADVPDRQHAEALTERSERVVDALRDAPSGSEPGRR